MTNTDAQPSLTVRRVINAPRETVFDAWVDPEVRKQWWCARPGMFCDLARIDARKGGRYRINMKDPAPGSDQQCADQANATDAASGTREWVVVGQFLEFDRPNRLTFTWSWEHADPTEPGTGAVDTVVTVEFREADGGTEVVLTHEGFATDQLRDEHQHGWTGCLGSLGAMFGETSP